MIVEYFPKIVTKRKSFFQIQKRFAYYRFHKRVGKGSWNKYIERYKLPRSIENTQRLIFNYEATYSEKKLSSSWLWNLPKKIALATTSDEVLNVWVYYRHKRKKAYHYLKVLKRLVDVGKCSTSDWRFKLITSRIENKINTFLNLPRICYYYGKLKATAQLESITKMLNHRLNDYLPHQLLLILKGFSLCELQDKHLFNKIRDLLKPHISIIPFYYLTIIIESYSFCLIHDYLFFNLLTNEIIYRINLCNNKYLNVMNEDNSTNLKIETSNELIEENTLNNFNDENLTYIIENEHALLKYKQDQFNYYPTMKNLIDIAYYFSNLKFQNYIFYDYISRYIIYMLKNSNCLNPHLIERVIFSFYKIKINDIKLFEHILKHIDTFIYDYPPSVLCAIGYYFSSLLPFYYSPINKIFKKMLLHIKKHMDILNLDSLSKLSSFVHKTKMDKKLQKDILFNINEQIKKNDNKNSKITYDIPRLTEILSYHDLIDETSFNILCKHLHSHLKYFEPCDFNRISRTLRNIKKKFNLCDEKIVNSIARNVIKQHDLFHVIDYHQTVNMLLEINAIKDIYKIYLIKHHNNISFYNFGELKLNYELPKEVKKSIYRYKKGTIYFSNKKIEQEYPLYKSIEN
ncbi:conserved Plasmodium protein, unknown function [Plasmodium gallinaceum]|uniref:RAP domain-containing protein n=1 Tax=Plasmodium gallinaceum TaxID=5849 RepID=A0A1J1GSJ2_PLAGA|nr:conserved Plasmodium protein, unknown function [Plasmodium gallinaceum]CRG94280.1 conserved Plasmodium protein, unknown function [Plasmodium gallinaceum]